MANQTSVTSVLSSGTISVWIEPAGSKRYDAGGHPLGVLVVLPAARLGEGEDLAGVLVGLHAGAGLEPVADDPEAGSTSTWSSWSLMPSPASTIGQSDSLRITALGRSTIVMAAQVSSGAMRLAPGVGLEPTTNRINSPIALPAELPRNGLGG